MKQIEELLRLGKSELNKQTNNSEAPRTYPQWKISLPRPEEPKRKTIVTEVKEKSRPNGSMTTGNGDFASHSETWRVRDHSPFLLQSPFGNTH